MVAACSFRAPASSTDAPPLDTPMGIDAAGTDSVAADARMVDAGVDAGADALPRRCVMTYPMVGTHRYKITASGTWMAAEAECELADAHLVTVDDAVENAAVVAAFVASGAYTWIGLRDPSPTDGVFVWTDGTAPYKAPTGTEVGTKTCVDLASSGAWSVFDCGYTGHAAVCECD